MRSRVLAMYTTVFQTVPLGFILGGTVSALMGEMGAMLACGGVFTTLNVIAYTRSRALRGV
jgi:predicted phage tail protein